MAATPGRQKSFFGEGVQSFRSVFCINAIATNQDLAITAFNILSQKVYRDKGWLDKTNKGLQVIGQNLDAGTYFVELKSANSSVFRKQVIK